MAKFKRLFTSAMAVAILAGSFTFTGCGPSQEELQQLADLKAEVKSLETELNELKSQKAELQRAIAEKEAKLEQCAKDKEATKANLTKIGK